MSSLQVIWALLQYDNIDKVYFGDDRPIEINPDHALSPMDAVKNLSAYWNIEHLGYWRVSKSHRELFLNRMLLSETVHEVFGN